MAQSTESCTTQAQANQQALVSAARQLSTLLKQGFGGPAPTPSAATVKASDVLRGDVVVDRFVQSFDGTAGRIWRQAFLVDTSKDKLTRLLYTKVVKRRALRCTWARRIASGLGALVLITAVYALLNAATRGYYVWSLRIAGFLLALVVISLFLGLV